MPVCVRVLSARVPLLDCSVVVPYRRVACSDVPAAADIDLLPLLAYFLHVQINLRRCRAQPKHCNNVAKTTVCVCVRACARVRDCVCARVCVRDFHFDRD